MPTKKLNAKQAGLTLVELLVVIVVIAILAALAILSFNGLQTRAVESGLKSDLRNASKQLGVFQAENDNYPEDKNLITGSIDTKFEYSPENGSYCLTATSTSHNKARAFHVVNGGAIEEGPCDGHQGSDESNSSTNAPSTMKDLTKSYCDNSMTVFNGSNSEAIISLTDNRGSSSQTYRVAKLADGNCWMLDNLKLGSTSQTTLLTPSDSNVDNNFTLPKITNGSGQTASDDQPQAVYPTPATGSAGESYGYLYNWSAATAGKTKTTMPVGSGNASSSICPKNWQLPTGGTAGMLAMLNAKMNSSSATSPSANEGDGYYQNWQIHGPFKGAYSGDWHSNGFHAQGSSGNLWTSTASPNHAVNAYSVTIANNKSNSFIKPGTDMKQRGYGFAVRCVTS